MRISDWSSDVCSSDLGSATQSGEERYRGVTLMFIAMNRFQVLPGEEKAFENVWLSRDTFLEGVPGFVEFHLLRGPSADDHTLYSSHTIWRSREDFEDWTRSDAFRQAHRNARSEEHTSELQSL